MITHGGQHEEISIYGASDRRHSERGRIRRPGEGRLLEASGIEDAVAVDAVKGLHEGILRGLSRLGIFDHDAAGGTPGHECGTGKLRVVINPDPIWGTTYEQQLNQSASDTGCGQRDIDLNREGLAVVVVEHVKLLVGPAIHQ